MVEKNYKPFAIFCSCHDPEHTMLVYPDDNEVILTVSLNKPTLWRRIKYLLGLSPWACYFESCLTVEDVDGLKKIISYLEG